MAQPEKQPLAFPGEKVEVINDQFWYPVQKPGTKPVNPHMIRPSGGMNQWKADMNWNDQPREKWATHLVCAPCATCGTPAGCDSCCDFLFGCFCIPCAAYTQRKTLLMNNLDNYECCAGTLGPRCTGCTHKCCPGGACGLCLEACCFPTCATLANRWMIKNHYNVENTCCETAFLWITCICTCLAVITRKHELREIGKLLWHTILGCMYAQQEHELRCRGYPDPRRFPQYHGHVVVAQVVQHPYIDPNVPAAGVPVGQPQWGNNAPGMQPGYSTSGQPFTPAPQHHTATGSISSNPATGYTQLPDAREAPKDGYEAPLPPGPPVAPAPPVVPSAPPAGYTAAVE